MNTRNLAILHRRADVSPEEFQRYWLETHSGFVVRVPSVYRFGTNLVLESTVEGLQPDAMGELWWRTPEDSEIGFKIPEGQRALQSGHNIIDQPRNTGMVLERLDEFLPEGASDPPPTVRSLSFVHRRADVSAEEFERYWREEHAAHALELGGVLKFASNRVRSSRIEGFLPDYVGEVWWESLEACTNRFTARGYEALIASGAEIIDKSRSAMITLQELETFYPPEEA